MSNPRRRLSPDVRRSEILVAASRLLARSGLSGFSLEGVAREAGIAPSLVRHYFGGAVGLLKAATEEVLGQIEGVMRDTERGLTPTSRMEAYLELVRRAPWGHGLWCRVADMHPMVRSLVDEARRRMVETMYASPWQEMSDAERLDGLGRLGYIEAVVSQWINEGMGTSETLVATLARVRDVRRPVGRRMSCQRGNNC